MVVEVCAGSAAGPDGSYPGESSGRGLSFVVADEGIERRKVDCSNDVYRVERSQCRLCERAGGFEQALVEWEECERVEQLACTREQEIRRQTWIDSCRAPDCAGDLGERKLAADQVGAGDEGTQCRAVWFVAHQLDERRRVGVEEGQLSARRGSRRARG